MTTLENINQIANLIRTAFPELPNHRVEFTVDTGSPEAGVSVSVHGLDDYQAATEFLRKMGCGVRDKSVFDTFTLLTGRVGGITFKTYPAGLPPTCRKVKYTERIPVEQTVQTGDFIEVERTKIVCDNGNMTDKD